MWDYLVEYEGRDRYIESLGDIENVESKRFILRYWLDGYVRDVFGVLDSMKGWIDMWDMGGSIVWMLYGGGGGGGGSRFVDSRGVKWRRVVF